MEGLPEELAPYARKIASSKLPHISVTPVRAQTKPWESRLLGVPYFPKDKRWPVDRDGKPLVMLAQINFAEMPPLEGYPTEGILQLYVSPGYDDTHGWGMRIDGAHKTELARLTDHSYFRAVYFPTVSHDAKNLIGFLQRRMAPPFQPRQLFDERVLGGVGGRRRRQFLYPTDGSGQARFQQGDALLGLRVNPIVPGLATGIDTETLSASGPIAAFRAKGSWLASSGPERLERHHACLHVAAWKAFAAGSAQMPPNKFAMGL